MKTHTTKELIDDDLFDNDPDGFDYILDPVPDSDYPGMDGSD